MEVTYAGENAPLAGLLKQSGKNPRRAPVASPEMPSRPDSFWFLFPLIILPPSGPLHLSDERVRESALIGNPRLRLADTSAQPRRRSAEAALPKFRPLAKSMSGYPLRYPSSGHLRLQPYSLPATHYSLLPPSPSLPLQIQYLDHIPHKLLVRHALGRFRGHRRDRPEMRRQLRE
jgi:hypothetical protein